jgi:hypothetical protein
MNIFMRLYIQCTMHRPTFISLDQSEKCAVIFQPEHEKLHTSA